MAQKSEMKKKFRTMYDTQGFDDREIPEGESMTDTSCYIPTEELIARFLRGEVLPRASEGIFEVPAGTSDEEAFEVAEQQQSVNSELKNIGENEVASRYVKLRKKIADDRTKKPKSDDKDPDGPKKAPTEAVKP